MRILHVYGTPYEMGKAQAQIFSSEIVNMLTAFEQYLEDQIEPYIKWLPKVSVLNSIPGIYSFLHLHQICFSTSILLVGNTHHIVILRHTRNIYLREFTFLACKKPCYVCSWIFMKGLTILLNYCWYLLSHFIFRIFKR